MLQHIKGRKQGFTLIELAIVLTIAGLLFVGLWRLLAGGNAQIRDQSVGNEQQQIIAAVKAYLGANPEGWLQTLPLAGAAANLALPTSNTSLLDCQGHIPNSQKGLCTFLPSGFTSLTPNAYGQTYSIQVARNDNTTQAPPVAPGVYSFMIATIGGDTIPDTSGGRISASVGNDGGFIYSQATVCGAPANQMACGAYGTWSANITNYNPWPTAPTTGHVVSRTFVSPSADNLYPWLERIVQIVPDAPSCTPCQPTSSWD